MRADDLSVIRRLDLFADMKQDHFDTLMHAAFLQRFPPQVCLIREGDPADFLYVVVDGCVELFAAANGRETTLSIVKPVATFILAAVVKDADYLMSARTMQPSQLLMIPAVTVRTVFDADHAFARATVYELALRYREKVKALKNQKLRGGVERLANYLLAEHAGQGGNGRLVLPVEKRTLAALLGMTPENLSRAFGSLGAYGVDVNGADISLKSPADLARLAKPSLLIDDPDI